MSERESESMARGIIALITDFGTRDYYVGAMKGAILRINPEARLVDISHEIPPGDISSGSLLLEQIRPFFPEKTIFLAVVDPGVGGDRRPIVIETDKGTFVGPDNGLFTSILRSPGVERIVEIKEKKYIHSNVSATFHGRDIFAPVAAHLSLGDVSPGDIGPVAHDPIVLESSRPVIEADRIRGIVMNCDRFGNLISNVPVDVLREFAGNGAVTLDVRGETIERFGVTYVSVGDGELVALIGSSGLLEVSVNGGSAKERLGAREGDEILIRRKEN
jgi:S-adenosylmethionine hydrolase